MDMLVGWQPRNWSSTVDATFTIFWDTTATEPWLVYPKEFANDDGVVDNGRIIATVNEVYQKLGDYVGRYSAIVSALEAIPTDWLAVGPLYRQVTWEPVVGTGGVAVTLAYARAADGSEPWFSETQTFSVTDQRVTAEVVTDAIAARAATVAAMAARAEELETALGIEVGVRFSVGGAL